MGRKKGFTLIELLVVISIIALLLAVMMPALQKVKEAGRRTVCAAHMKDIGLGLHVYSQDNNSWLPPRFSGSRARYNDLPINHWSRWFMVENGSSEEFWNLGILWESKIVRGTGEIFFCPSKLAPFQYEDYADPRFPTGTQPEAGNATGVRIPYTYNPECKSENNRTRKYTKISECGSTNILLTDLLSEAGIAHEKGWNVMMGDTSVRFSIEREAQRIIEESADRFGHDDYESFDKVIELLKH